MRDGAEILAVSAVTTIIALALVPLPQMAGEAGAGAQGDAVVTVAASSASIEQMVERWEAPPEAVVETPQVDAPPTMQAPPPPAAPSEPTPTARPLPMAPTAPTMSSPPQTDTAAPAPRHAPDSSPRPPRRPAAEPQPQREPAQVASQPSQAQAEQRAQGAGQSANAGQSQQRQTTSTVSAATKRTLMSQWGGQIQGVIARRAPRGAGRGKAVVRLTVTASGALAGVALAQSSGNPKIDRLALQAVRSAGRFSPAPAALGSGPFSFTLPIQSR